MSERFWIQEAIGKEGSYRASVARRYGKSAFDPEGKIKMSIIRKDIKTKKGKVHKQAVLARTLRRF